MASSRRAFLDSQFAIEAASSGFAEAFNRKPETGNPILQADLSGPPPAHRFDPTTSALPISHLINTLPTMVEDIPTIVRDSLTMVGDVLTMVFGSLKIFSGIETIFKGSETVFGVPETRVSAIVKIVPVIQAMFFVFQTIF
jgi:hypothetical protein